ncbi:hypothetical protein FGO68_gene13363 [Halteria grandinella]|uniref:Uncharacterized protein n=1 Tax=Halteria grandinella TaxID=5974 RepID=A0A8J8NB87_HALGN|nr:hypothetical protein FGO68_gene13363 [Halteria grandinella]
MTSPIVLPPRWHSSNPIPTTQRISRSHTINLYILMISHSQPVYKFPASFVPDRGLSPRFSISMFRTLDPVSRPNYARNSSIPPLTSLHSS